MISEYNLLMIPTLNDSAASYTSIEHVRQKLSLFACDVPFGDTVCDVFRPIRIATDWLNDFFLFINLF